MSHLLAVLLLLFVYCNRIMVKLNVNEAIEGEREADDGEEDETPEVTAAVSNCCTNRNPLHMEEGEGLNIFCMGGFYVCFT